MRIRKMYQLLYLKLTAKTASQHSEAAVEAHFISSTPQFRGPPRNSSELNIQIDARHAQVE
jgi:hypothetical protein